MSTTIRITDLPVFDSAEYLTDEQEIAAYLSAVLAEEDPGLLAAALGDIAGARSVSLTPEVRPARRLRK